MLAKTDVSIFDFVYALTETVDLVFQNLNKHHKKVAYISGRISREMKLPNSKTQDIILAAMLHDIGALSIEDRSKLLQFESFGHTLDNHALFGCRLLKDFAPLANVAKLIKYHHANYDPLQNDIPMGSYIIHLADRISVLINEHFDVLQQVPEICAKIKQHQEIFHPKALKAFARIANVEAFWVEALSPATTVITSAKTLFTKGTMDLETLQEFARVFVHLIDYRSRFTSTHSSGVAAVALELAIIDGFSERECKLMEIAGLLHDLGKLTVPSEILEKNGVLDADEMHYIRKHSYFTYAILSNISGLEHIAEWAAYHHERIDGNGYPFHVQGKNFSKFARIIAVADVMTALAEDRPYRLAMKPKKVMRVLHDMAARGGIDKNIVELVKKNFLRINKARIKAQQEAQRKYEAFDSLSNETEKTKMRSAGHNRTLCVLA